MRSGERSRGVRDGVELGYGVVEDYLEQARAVASSFGGRDDRETGFNRTTGFDPLGQWWRASRRLGEAWFEVLGALSGASYPNPPRTPPAPWRDSPEPQPRPSNEAHRRAVGSPGDRPLRSTPLERITYEITSIRPVRISLDLDPNAELDSLTVATMYCRDDDQPPLDGIRFRPVTDAAGVRLQVSMPVDATEALYVGRIVDSRSAQTRGVLTVQVLSDSG